MYCKIILEGGQSFKVYGSMQMVLEEIEAAREVPRMASFTSACFDDSGKVVYKNNLQVKPFSIVGIEESEHEFV